MLTPSLVAPRTPLRAIGNTPAVSLTRSLPRGVDADILLLGCVDVRHLLYTAYSEQGLPPRKIDVTCCDVQDHIVARNVLLLSFLCDDDASPSAEGLWDIYYQKYLSDSDIRTLQTQARKLLELSRSLQGWQTSSYGKLLRFCDQITLDSTRDIWKGYDDAASLRNTALYRKNFSAALKRSDGLVGSASVPPSSDGVGRSAAPLFTTLADDVQAATENIWAQEVLGVASASDQHPNPLFATALSDSVTLAFPSNPLLSFHLATAGLNLTESSPLRTEGPAADGPSYSKLIQAAKLQFAEWTSAFKNLSSQLVIRYVAGDCSAFCQTLQHNFSTGETSANLYRRQLDMRPFVLDVGSYGEDGDAPRRFDTIDASDLSDDVGALNLLVSAAPLLKDKPSSTLQTEIVARGQDGDKANFESLLCGHTRLVSLLLGIAPLEYWTNATAVSYLDELWIAARGERPGSHGLGAETSTKYRFPWKFDSCLSGEKSVALSMAPEELASLLLKLYLGMFRHEHESLPKSAIGKYRSVASSAYSSYHRGSFVAMVETVCSRVHTDAAKVGRLLIEGIRRDETLLSSRPYADELALEMSRSAIYSEDRLTQHVQRDQSSRPFCKWRAIPEAVAVTIMVPLSSWKPVLHQAFDGGNSVVLEGQLRAVASDFLRSYAAVQVTFGTLTALGSPDDDSYTVSVKPDDQGLLGESPLIASFYASAAVLQDETGTSQAALCLKGTMLDSLALQGDPNLDLTVFETKLEDGEHVYITKHAPGLQGLPVAGSLWHRPGVQTADATFTPEIDDATGDIIAISGRSNITSDEGRRLLEAKVPVKIHQTSPFTIEIVFGERALVQTITFPVPVTDENSKARIARKSSYVEVIRKIAEPSVSVILDDYIYPTVITQGRPKGSAIPATLNIPHLNLDTLPIIDTSDKSSIRFLGHLCSSTFSTRERRLREELQASNARTAPSPRFNFKETLFTMFMVSSGLQGGQTGLVALAHPKTGVNMLLFVSALRLDAANASVVLDAAVIPMTNAMLRDKDFEAFLLLLRTLECCDIIVDGAELVLWRKVLPALAERCRTWSHAPDCEYSAQGKVPVSLDPGAQVLCSCGQGQLPDGFVGVPDWEEAARKYATRIAISPTFAVPFVEDVVDKEVLAEEVRRQPERCRNCGATEARNGGALKKCTRCLEVKYCSAECQKKDWKKHRMECEEAEVYHQG